jgi:hypothetical protein
VDRFPKTYKYTMGERIKGSLLDMLETVIFIGEYGCEKNIKSGLKKLNSSKDKIQIFARMCQTFNIIDKRRYLYISELLNEIGRIIGGWAKKVK